MSIPHFHGKVGGQMPSVNTASLRDEFDAVKAEIASLRKEGEISKEADVIISGLCRLLGLLFAVLFRIDDKKDQ